MMIHVRPLENSQKLNKLKKNTIISFQKLNLNLQKKCTNLLLLVVFNINYALDSYIEKILWNKWKFQIWNWCFKSQ